VLRFDAILFGVLGATWSRWGNNSWRQYAYHSAAAGAALLICVIFFPGNAFFAKTFMFNVSSWLFSGRDCTVW